SKPLPLGGPPGQVTIQSDFFFNKDLEYLRYDSKGSRPALSISKMKAAYYPDAGLEQMVPNQFWIEEEYKYEYATMVQMMMRFNEIHKFSDGTLQQINEALDYRVKEFRINRMNPGLNTRFWTSKDVDRCKAFKFAIQRRLRIRRIFHNLESFVGGHWVFNSLVHLFRALSALRRSGLRTASTAAKPCQGDSSEFYLITGRIPTVAAAGQKDVNSQLHAHTSTQLPQHQVYKMTHHHEFAIARGGNLLHSGKERNTSIIPPDKVPEENLPDT
nr:hypothetical protein [Tanacetum cinerariifolium]